MSDSSKTKDFPDLSLKLNAPAKKSLFERQKAEAEAKRAREEAATAAVYEDFVKSFDDDGPSQNTDRFGSRSGPSPGSLGPGRRHFSSTLGRNSGPGSLGPAPNSRNSGPGSLGPPPNLGRKRTYEDGFPPKRSHGMFAYNDHASSGPKDAASAFKTSDDEDERISESKAEDRAAAKPTIQLLSLPPGTSPAAIKAMIPPLLSIDNVRIISSQPPTGPNASSTERKSFSAIVTLAKETPASDIDTVVNILQNKYLGLGYYLSISRYLSSAAVNSSVLSTSAVVAGTNLPFGAKPIQQGGPSLSRAPPPGHRGFAPPASYNNSGFSRNTGTQVTVQPPNDLRQLRLIHKTLEALLTYGPEFEALLMGRPSVQKEEKWAWLWNSRSAGGVYFRWRLYELVSGSQNNRVGGDGQLLFEKGAYWLPPDRGLRYEYTTQMEELVSDPDYDSSDEEDDERGATNQAGGPLDGEGQNDGNGYLTPISRAKLVHLLARLPDTNARLRKGDVARVTAFAIDHAGAGADEVVELITANVLLPLSYTKANPDYEAAKKEAEDRASEGGDGTLGDNDKGKPRADTSAASLVGLYIVSDILSSSSTSGVRHAWRYRSLFEAVMKRRGVFESLGRIDKELGWGKLKAEKWRRSIHSILDLWAGWCVFSQDAHDHFVESFDNPPLTEAEKAEAAKEEQRKLKASEEDKKAKSRWKSVEDAKEDQAATGWTDQDQDMMDIDDNLDDDALIDEELDGEPMIDSSDEEGEDTTNAKATLAEHETNPAEQMVSVQDSSAPAGDIEGSEISSKPPTRRQRPTAADMFADDSGDE